MRFILIFIAISLKLNATIDTVRIKIEDFIKLETFPDLSEAKGKYYLNNKEIDSAEFFRKKKELEYYAAQYTLSKGKYCYFVDNQNKVLVEGMCANTEGFRIVGTYKEYYKNGRVKVIGTYSVLSETKNGFAVSKFGYAAGEWTFYNKKGKIVRSCKFENPQLVSNLVELEISKYTKSRTFLMSECK